MINDALLFLNGIVTFALVVVSCYLGYLAFKQEGKKVLGKHFALLATLQTFFFVLLILLFTRKILLSSAEFLVAEALINLSFFIFFFSTTFKFIKKPQYFFILPLAISIFFLNKYFFLYFCLGAMFSLLLLAFHLRHYDKSLTRAKFLIILYAISTGLFFLVALSGVQQISYYFFLTTLLALPAIVFLYKSSISFNVNTPVDIGTFHHNVFFFFRYFLFIIFLTTFLIIGVISVHEMGHAISAKQHGCQDTEIILFGSDLSSHTSTFCEGNLKLSFILYAGILLPILTAIVFFIIGETFIKQIAYFILGTSLLISQNDILNLGFHSSIALIVSTVGLGILTYAVIKIGIYEMELDFEKQSVPTRRVKI